MTQTDQQHIRSIRTGDTAGLHRIYREFLPRIHALITANGGSYDDARDVFQDALIVLFDKCREENFSLSSSFSTLLYGVCRNLWGNRLQKKSRTEVSLTEDIKFNDSTDIEFDFVQAERESIFWDALRRLGTECRKLMELFFEKKSMEEIAKTMRLSSVGYAKKRKFMCKEQLIEQVKSDARYQEWTGDVSREP